ncbi:hypothetical protein BGAL_0149g00180 [Botrytis galanthina]|uniref:Uncharacterized protein n=1 Tax=Botrytis galanthina TaxID=278940 RepID=A0A4V4HUR9_9HELO|nr:hypothetical protein BGAL_0149g00180 [Botrytis galanthina]
MADHFFSKEIMDQGADSARGNNRAHEEGKEGNGEGFGVEGKDAGNVVSSKEYGTKAGVDEEDVRFRCADIG